MRRTLPHQMHGDQAGATLVIVTLSLLALFGMMVLVVDVGSLLFARRALVNAADAAALAAAQSCGQKEGRIAADVQATMYTKANASGAIVMGGYPSYWPSCDFPAGFVTVRVTTDRPLYFAPVLGLDPEAPVVTEATAAWGGAGAGEKVAPLMLSWNRLSSCEIPPENPEDLPRGTECAFWWDNSPSGGQQNPDLANAEWGTLDLLKWDILPPVHCDNSTPPQFEEWMLRGFPLPLPIDSDLYGGIIEGPDPDNPERVHTYVCRGQGNFGAALDHDIEAAACPIPGQVGCDPLYFPVNRQTTQVDADGDVCGPDEFVLTNCAVDKYDIVGFARLYVVALYKGNTQAALDACAHLTPPPERDANARCLVARWEEYTNEGLNPQGGENFGLVPVRLTD
jgi:hypothetical protein